MILQANHVSFQYTEKSPLILDDVSLRIAEGERVGLRGKSGIGKTTLCRLLAGYERPTRGEVLLAETGEDRIAVPMSENCPEEARRVADGAAPDSDSARFMQYLVDGGAQVAEIVAPHSDSAQFMQYRMSGEHSARTASRNILDIRGCCPVQMIWQHPEQAVNPRRRMRTVLKEGGEIPQRIIEGLGIEEDWQNRFPAELSGGELQRFCIARALGENTRFLLCDEISTMLDLITQSQIWNFLIEETSRRGIGLLMVSHSDALMERVCTRIVDVVTDKTGRCTLQHSS